MHSSASPGAGRREVEHYPEQVLREICRGRWESRAGDGPWRWPCGSPDRSLFPGGHQEEGSSHPRAQVSMVYSQGWRSSNSLPACSLLGHWQVLEVRPWYILPPPLAFSPGGPLPGCAELSLGALQSELLLAVLTAASLPLVWPGDVPLSLQPGHRWMSARRPPGK